MNEEKICILNSVIIAVLLNWGLSWFSVKNATAQQKEATKVSSLPITDQMVNMLVHHHNTPVSSGILIALVVAASVWLGYYLNPYEKVMDFLD